MGNRYRDLQDYCRAAEFSGDVDELAASIREIQERAFDVIWRQSELQSLNGQEIENLTREHLAQQEPWLNDIGRNGLLQWVA